MADAWYNTMASGDTVTYENWNTMSGAICHNPSESARWKHFNTSDYIYFEDDGNQFFKFEYDAGTKSILYGADSYREDIHIMANSVSPYSRMILEGSGNIYLDTYGDIYFRLKDNRIFTFTSAGSNKIMYGGTSATMNLMLAANSNSQLNGNIFIEGQENITVTSYADILFKEQNTQMFKFEWDGSDKSYIKGGTDANHDVVIQANTNNAANGYLGVYGQGDITLAAYQNINFYEQSNPMFEFKLVGGESIINTDTANTNLILDSEADIFFREQGTQMFKMERSGDDNILTGGSAANDDMYLVANSNDALPWIRMFGAGSVEINYGTGNDFRIDENEVQVAKFVWDGANSTIYGGSATGNDLIVQCNSSADAYPFIRLYGKGQVDIDSYNNIYFKEQGTQMFKFAKSLAVSKIYGSDVSGNLQIIASENNTYPMIRLYGSGTSYGIAGFDIPANTDSNFRVWLEGSTKLDFSPYYSYFRIMPSSNQPPNVGGIIWFSGSLSSSDLYYKSGAGGDWKSLTKGAGGGIDHIREDTEIDGWDSGRFTNSGLMWNGSNWIPMPSGGSGGGVSTLSALNIDNDKDWNSKGIHNASYISGVNIRGSYLKTTEKLEHVGDPDTYLALKPDQANLVAGGVSGIAIQADGDTVIGADGDIYFKDDGTQLFRFHSDTTNSYIYGQDAGNKWMQMYANDSDSYPKIVMRGASSVDIHTDNYVYLYDQTAQIAKFYLNGADSFIQGGADTSDDLEIKANSDDDYPYITLNGSGSIVASYGPNDGGFFRIRNKTDTQFTFSGTSTIAKLYGPDSAGNDLRIYANTANDFPHIRLKGDDEIELRTKNRIEFYKENEQLFKFSGTASLAKLYGPDATGNDLYIYANSVDSRPSIQMNGNGQFVVDLPDGSPFKVWNAGGSMLVIKDIAGSSQLYGGTSTGKVLKIKPTEIDTYPYIEMTGSGSIDIHSKGDNISLYSGSTRKINLDTSTGTISGSWMTPRYDNKPTASEHPGEIIRVSGGTDEKTWVYMSVKNDANSWEWIQLAVST